MVLVRSFGLTLLLAGTSCAPAARPAVAEETPSSGATAVAAATSASVTTAAPPSDATPGPALDDASRTRPTTDATVDPEPVDEGPCPDDMVDVGIACIDRYEAPNEKGKKPLLMQSALDGEAWCAERGKRLCKEVEWNRACMGKRGYNFPYGAKWKRGVCNDDKTWKLPRWKAIQSHPSAASKKEAARLDQSEPAGAREGCVSPDGVHDLTGNAAEWVVRTEDNDTNYDHVVKGCYWARCYRPPHTPSCDYVNWMHRGAERSYEMGFRCCKDRK